jgi:glycosyltransferase involved in cell wall biosynthesis
LKINENRQVKSSEYTDVQGGLDYALKVVRFALRGFKFHVHVNGHSRKGYLLALFALLLGRLTYRPSLLTFHGGLSQPFFPRGDRSPAYWAFKLLFRMAEGVRCDSPEIKNAIEEYHISSDRVTAISAFSSRYLDFVPAQLEFELERFFTSHDPVFFCYVSFRPEYRLEVLRDAMRTFCKSYPRSGFIWLGFPEKEMPDVADFVGSWSAVERESLLVLGNIDHNKFLTLLNRSSAYIRTPACDGVSASVLEAIAMGVPVVASENGHRPKGVITYQENNASDLCTKLEYVIGGRSEHRSSEIIQYEDNIRLIADWVLS